MSDHPMIRTPLRISQKGMKIFETENLHWSVVVAQGIKPEDLLHIDVWVSRSKLRHGDLIYAQDKDGSWWAEYLVDRSHVSKPTRLFLLRVLDKAKTA
jgi:hypothetical protein